MTDDNCIIRVENLHKYFGTNHVLRGIDLEVRKGEVIAVIGPSGSGKSTLIRCLNLLEKATDGKIFLDGSEIANLKSEKEMDMIRVRMGMVFQQFNLYPHKTVLQNLTLAPIKLHHKPKKEAEELAYHYLDVVGLRDKANVYPTTLSGGQQQRVAIARALVNRPKVLLLDEPLGALDLRLRKDMQNELKRIQQAMGITFIYVTHDQEEALSMSDTVVVMDGGRIQQIGTPEDIYNEPKNAFVADFIGESNILDGIMRADGVVEIFNRRFQCLDSGFEKDEPVDVVIRPEDVDIVPENEGQLKGTVTAVTFKGVHYDIIVDFYGFKWLIQTTDLSPVGSRIGIKIDPDGIHVMKKSQYSGMFGDYSSYSEEYEEISDAEYTPEDEEGEERDEAE